MDEFIPFALPDIGHEEIDEVVDSLRSGWLTTGPKTKRFEKDFAEFLGGDVQAFAVNSATSGLHLALEAAGIKPGDEVITTPNTFTATAEVVAYLGADVVFADIDPETLNIDPDNIKKVITSRTKAIITVHFGGLACEMDSIFDIAQNHDLKVVEDAAHSLPTTYKGQLIGNLNSDATVFSFYVTKTLAVGEGGMLVTKNNKLAERCKTMRLHGISRDVFDRYLSDAPSWYYEVVAPGFKYNMTDISASLGIHQLRKIHKFRARRQEIARKYDKAFKELPLILPPKASGEDLHAWHLYVIRLDNMVKKSRDDFIELMKQKGVGCSVHFIPLHIQPWWKNRYNFEESDFPITFDIYQKTISLPIYTKMTDNDQNKVIQSVYEFFS